MAATPSVASSFIPWQVDARDAWTAKLPRQRVETFPAGRLVSIDTNEFDEFNECAAGWSVRHHVLDASTCRSTVFLVMTPSLQVGLVQHAMGYASQGENPVGTISVAVPVDEARLMVHRGHCIGPLQIGVTRSGEGYECVCRTGSRFVVASVAEDRAERYAADLWHEPDLWKHSPDRLRFKDPAHRSSYLDACERILGAVDEQPGVLEDRRAAALLEEKVLESLFLNARVAAAHGAHEPSRYNLARKAYRYLQDRADEVPSIRDICAATRASYATLERAFRETYGMTPKVMMTAMRLAGVRRALLQPSPTTTITPVALRWGFVEFGRFSAQYRQRYGEVPSETLRRTRGEPRGERAASDSLRTFKPASQWRAVR